MGRAPVAVPWPPAIDMGTITGVLPPDMGVEPVSDPEHAQSRSPDMHKMANPPAVRDLPVRLETGTALSSIGLSEMCVLGSERGVFGGED